MSPALQIREIREMNLEQLTDLFKWMTIINVGLLFLSSGLVMILKGIICKMHGKLFGIKEESVAVAAYGYLGLYKILVIVFCIVPYISLLLIK
jgi:archaellum biogenesis protein FlaJ (TadC family)